MILFVVQTTGNQCATPKRYEGSVSQRSVGAKVQGLAEKSWLRVHQNGTNAGFAAAVVRQAGAFAARASGGKRIYAHRTGWYLGKRIKWALDSNIRAINNAVNSRCREIKAP